MMISSKIVFMIRLGVLILVGGMFLIAAIRQQSAEIAPAGGHVPWMGFAVCAASALYLVWQWLQKPSD